jgi:hypothetical protein
LTHIDLSYLIGGGRSLLTHIDLFCAAAGAAMVPLAALPVLRSK